MNNNISNKEKVISLYKFIKEFWESKQKVILNDDAYEWKCNIDNIPVDDENISIFYSDKVEEDNLEIASEQDCLLRVHKPDFEKCPEPDEMLKEWLENGWEDYKKNVQVIEKKEHGQENEEGYYIEKFEQDEDRIKKYEMWVDRRNLWAIKQEKIEKTRNFFTELYIRYNDLQRDLETKELVIANGYIQDRSNIHINHPIITKRLNIYFDAKDNTIYINNTNTKTELCSEIFHEIEDISLELLANLTNELEANDYHPMDRNDTNEFLKVFIHALSSDSKYIEHSRNITEDTYKNNRFIMTFRPCIIMRKRPDGTGNAIQQIIKNIEATNHIPSHLIDIVSGGTLDKIEEKEDSLEENLAKVGGESIDILLSKEANSEQLEIAKRIEKYNAVIVQGPPGTGKTHTIANLIGHFLAQGKSILVTSFTPKALSVLKEKIPKNLRDLCVSVCADSNTDMENSIDGITEFMSKTTSFELKKHMNELKIKRTQIIEELSTYRKKYLIFLIKSIRV